MIDNETLKHILIDYKGGFLERWESEKFKWMAIKQFQDNWDIDSDDFSGMLECSLKKTESLLATPHYLPRDMIIKISKAAPEETRNMFRSLYDESVDVAERIENFKDQSAQLRERYIPKAKNDYQKENAISVYLWLRYPDKYYIYKYTEINAAAVKLKSDYHFKEGAYVEDLRNAYDFYNELCNCICADTNLINLFRSQLTDDCYLDPNFITLTVDVGFYIGRKYPINNTKSNQKQDRNHTKESLAEINVDSLHSNSRFVKWYEPLVDTLIKMGGSGKRSDVLQQMFVDYNVTQDQLNDVNSSGDSKVINDIDWARNYLVYEGFLNKENRGDWSLTDLGENVIMNRNLAEKISAKWARIDEAKRNNKPIPEIDLTPYYIYRDSVNYQGDDYSEDAFCSEVFISKEDYKELKSILLDNLNVILYGPPGVGKTFAARRLAYSIMGKMDDDHIEMIQFHQNYSYEDFVMGYKPEGDQFVLKEGVFYRFCKKAEKHPNEKFFFIIDEINRGNLSKIMGELMMLIEKDKREKAKVTLAYSDEQFTVPKNLYIIGMMNTADRSLAMIDYALRRRFSFYEMEPAFDSDGFKTYRESLNSEMFNKLIDTIKELNQAITDAEDLGKGYCIGHSYFSEWDESSKDKIKEVVNYNIIPMLEEYWFEETESLEEWKQKLKEVYE